MAHESRKEMTMTMNVECELVITRVFEAPRERIFRAMTEPRHLVHWWGPAGFELTVAKLELRPGGEFVYGMDNKKGFSMWGKFVYREVIEPRLLVFTSGFCDKAGNWAPSPFGGDWPREVMNRWTLEEAGGKTTLTVRCVPHQATEAEQKAFLAMHKSMHGGYGSTFDQLVEYLGKKG
jgi:uncharacterized protein YndB with AHSA1/START domain